MLGAANRAGPPHQRTLRAALDWSRDLASSEERILWQRLSVFPSTFDLPAVEAVCCGEGLERRRILDALDGLIDKSLVSASRVEPEMRYRMLDSVRQYGAEALGSCKDVAVLRSRHRDYYAELCAAAWRHWVGPDQARWFNRLETEHDNLRAALDWCVENREPEAGAAMAAHMWLYWGARGHLTEGRRRLATLMEEVPPDSAVRAKALWVAGYLGVAQVDAGEATPLLQASIEVGQASGDRESVAFATQYLGLCALFAGDLGGALDGMERAFDMHLRHGGRAAAAFTLTDLAVTVMLAGDTNRASVLYERALAMVEDLWTRSHCLWGAGLAAWLQGDLHGAEKTEKEALRLIAELDERSGTALCLHALAWIAASREDLERATVLQGAALSVWESVPGHVPAPVRHHDEECECLTRRGLGTTRRDRLFETGRRLDRAAAVAYALEANDKPPGPAVSASVTGGLSKRELEVAELVAAGLSDRDIATRLVISQRTAESHVQHILTKLSFRSRTQIAVASKSQTVRAT